MTSNKEQVGKGNAAERGVRFLRNVHIALGAVLFPQVEVLTVFAGYEAINALGHEAVRRVVDTRKQKQPKTVRQRPRFAMATA